MISEFQIKNYLCFEDLTAPLGPLTVLIGENNTGKSCFLRAIARAANKEFVMWEREEKFRFDYDRRTSLTVKLTSGETYTVEADPVPHLKNVRLAKQECLNDFAPINFFDVPKLKLSMVSKGITSNIDIATVLQDDGEQIAGLVDYLLRNDRKSFDAIEAALVRAIPGVESLVIDTPEVENRQLRLIIENGLTIKASQMSVGVKLMIFFITLAYHPTPPRTLLIEEPETGVHPKRLRDILNLLRGMTQGRHGRHPVQVILSTHSPYLLDCVDLEQDKILVFERDLDGNRGCRPVDQASLKQWTDEFLLGELWMAGDEKGLLGEGLQLEK